VTRIEAGNPDAILVWTDPANDNHHDELSVIYTLDRQLRPLSVTVNDQYQVGCEALVREGKIPPLPSTDPIEELRTVRWWNGQSFEDVTVPRRQAVPKR